MIDRVAETVRERFDLKRLVQTLTTQGRMSRWIVSALPLGIIIVLQLENPHYVHPLLASTGGQGRLRPRRGLGRRGILRDQEDRRDRGLR